jgi:thiosulfate/3-mercaptopyruvate sulfurtransferase
MNTENYFTRLAKLFVLFPLLITILIFSALFAQVNSITQLKKDNGSLKEKENAVTPSDPWTIKHIITTYELVNELKNDKTAKLRIYYVGFSFLYQQGHIPGSIYAGPASKQDGIDKLKNAVKGLKKGDYIVIYCGCCPWKDCPNIRQAYSALKDLGYTNVKVLYLPDNFPKDWKNKGYAVEGKN